MHHTYSICKAGKRNGSTCMYAYETLRLAACGTTCTTCPGRRAAHSRFSSEVDASKEEPPEGRRERAAAAPFRKEKHDASPVDDKRKRMTSSGAGWRNIGQGMDVVVIGKIRYRKD